MGRAKSLGFRAVTLDQPLTMSQDESLRTALECLRKAARLVASASNAINDAEIDGLEPVPVFTLSMSSADVFAVLEQSRMLMEKRMQRMGLKVRAVA
ncbi:hypothetical protein SAMN05216428_102453 [Nitrosospira sp. Nsp11]|uniref:hypothetical protein n=1 Tax=Nitrosospira sp. Nsp11 TaxID=1855338 RepID=UPI000913CDC0|nr:hypothetical protein [Nitrosospira sp. Nsp11]SHL45412.1 hypothetical protein SAMN05216428_102453 [Nitrosospira sp. Nsp11]